MGATATLNTSDLFHKTKVIIKAFCLQVSGLEQSPILKLNP